MPVSFETLKGEGNMTNSIAFNDGSTPFSWWLLLGYVYRSAYRLNRSVLVHKNNTLFFKYKFNYWQNAARLEGGGFNLLQKQ